MLLQTLLSVFLILTEGCLQLPPTVPPCIFSSRRPVALLSNLTSNFKGLPVQTKSDAEPLFDTVRKRLCFGAESSSSSTLLSFDPSVFSPQDGLFPPESFIGLESISCGLPNTVKLSSFNVD